MAMRTYLQRSCQSIRFEPCRPKQHAVHFGSSPMNLRHKAMICDNVNRTARYCKLLSDPQYPTRHHPVPPLQPFTTNFRAVRTQPEVSHRKISQDHSLRSNVIEPAYQAPTAGVLSYLPSSWVPYAELARLEKPAGALYLFFPCIFSTIMASTYTSAGPASMFATIGLFGAGALVMRGAGCTINDLWDRDFDPKVKRTRLRPLARRAVQPAAALAFAGAQCLAGLAVLLRFPQPECLIWGAPSLILVALYPLAKRVTHYPQVVLGLTFSWGALMGFPAFGINLASDYVAAQAAACLYASCVSWTVLYDMIYAHMDVQDDRRAGIKSIALRHEQATKPILAGLALVQISLLAGAGMALDFGPAFFAGSCGGSLCTLALMIWKVKLQDPASCWWWFKYGAWLTGGTITAGLLGNYLLSQEPTHDVD